MLLYSFLIYIYMHVCSHTQRNITIPRDVTENIVPRDVNKLNVLHNIICYLGDLELMAQP